MGRFMLSYVKRSSPVHALTGAVKLVIFLLWSIIAMTGYDTRVMGIMAAMGIVLFIISGTRLSEVSFIFKMLTLFMCFNLAGIYLFAPEQGVVIYGSRHVLLEGAGRFTLTAEQLFYEFNIFLKYCMIVPAAILLIVTTHPSEFAASLNRIGVHYYLAYAVSLTLRYIPDVQRDYLAISRAQQARGIELSRKNSLVKRIRGAAAILLPLIFSTLDRIDTVSHAMELRSFGKYKKRSWYSGRPFGRADIAALVLSAALFAFGMWFIFRDGSRFYNPFTD
ncbi:MAG: energy-coupling factor transporter transmembrane protein EcfT [Treponema sp.]|jgi:energy-coupling factor transport system permease protein|nr:energy-coupling factor transporter transmembrane protein EcfT [Treponema sp.]